MTRTRVLMVIPTLDRSGAEKQFTLLATSLPRDRYEIQVAALTRGGPFERELHQHGIVTTILNKRWKLDPSTLWRLTRIVRSWKPDLIHSWLFAGNAYCRMVAGGRNQPPVIVSERCVDSWKSGWQLTLDRWLIPRAARIVGNSKAVTEFYRQQGVPDKKLRVVYNGQSVVEADSADNVDHQGNSDARHKLLGLPPGSKVLMYVGRLARQKRVIDLLWMLVLINNVRSDTYLIVIGDGPERDHLERISRELNVENFVKFLGHRDDANALLPLADLFCLASDFEGMSNSLMEAMSVGLPVLASDIPPNRELVVSDQTGLLIPVGDRVSFARAAISLIDDPAKARQLGDHGQQRIREQFSVESMVAGYDAVYQEVLREHSLT